MAYDTLKKEQAEILKQKKSNRLLNYIILLVGIFSVFLITTNFRGSISDMFFAPVTYQIKTYPFLVSVEFLLLVGVLLWWKGNDFKIPLLIIRKKKFKKGFIIYPTIAKVAIFRILNRQIKKIPVINTLFIFLNYKGKENELQDFFYKAPVQTDELDRAKNIIFTDYKPEDFFKGDYKNIINLFKGESFEEKEKTFNDLIAVMEGVFKDYSKGYSHLHINEKTLKSPFKVKNIMESAVFDRKEGEIHFSTKQMLDTFTDFCNIFEGFIERYSKYQTKINKLYASELSDEKVRKRIVLMFKLVMFRRLFKLYMNIPAGWMVIRLEDYNAKAIMSSIDRETLVIIDSRNKGDIKGFPDDRFVRMFLLIYHYFFTKTEYAKIFKNVLEVLTPDKTAKDMEDFILKNRSSLEADMPGFIKEEEEKENNASSN